MRLGMKERVTKELAHLVDEELNSPCPEESMARYLFDYSTKLISSKFENGTWKIVVQRGDTKFELCLKPDGWRKLP